MEYKKLGDICDIASGGTPLRSKLEYWSDGTIPWLKITNIKEKYISKANEYITQSGLDNSSAKMFSKGTVLYTIFATLGEVGILDFEASTNQAIAGIKVKDDDKLNREYLYYFLKSKKNYVNGIGRGVAQNNINMSILRNFKIPLPNLSVQNKIVNVLNRVSNVIEWRKNQISKYDELIKARFVGMFGDPITNPMRWEMVSIGDVVKEVKYGTSKPAIEGGKYPYLRMNNLTMDGHLDLSDLKFIDIPNDEIEKYIVRQGDVLFNRTNSVDLVGKTAVFDLPDAMIIAGYIIRIRLNERLLPEIFSQYMNLEALKSILKNMAKGAVNQANINAQELKKIKIYVPDIQTQRQFIKIKEQIDKSKFVVQKSLDKAQLLFDSLMQEYFG